MSLAIKPTLNRNLKLGSVSKKTVVAQPEPETQSHVADATTTKPVLKVDFTKMGFNLEKKTAPVRAQKKKPEVAPIVQAFETILETKLAPEQYRNLIKSLETRHDLAGLMDELADMVKSAAEQITTKQMPVAIRGKVLDFLLGVAGEECPLGNQYSHTETKSGAKKVHTYADTGASFRELEMLSQGMVSKEALTALFGIYYERNQLTRKGTGNSNAPRVSADKRMRQYFAEDFEEIIKNDQSAIAKAKDSTKKRDVFNPEDFAINRNYYKDHVRVQESKELDADGQALMDYTLERIREETQIILTTKKALAELKKEQKE